MATTKKNRSGRASQLSYDGGPRDWSSETVARAARRRRKALAPKTAEGEAQEVIDADIPILITRTKGIRSSVGQWVEMRAENPNLTNGDIAAKIGISRGTLQGYISRAVQEGWLKFDDALSRVEYELIPKTITNLSEMLDAKDQRATIETAKGTIFPAYQKAKGLSEAALTVLAIKFEQPEGENQRVIQGHIIGKPKVIEE